MNGQPVLFGAIDTKKGGASYTFVCTSCGRTDAAQPDTACAACEKPKRRRPARKATSPANG